jgi:hypothetical protein
MDSGFCSKCSVRKIYCGLCKWIYCPAHENIHDKGIACFSDQRLPEDGFTLVKQICGDASTSVIDKACHTSNGKFMCSGGFYICPSPGCKKLAFSNCGENKCCGFFCQEHIYHSHFICHNNQCNKLGKVIKYYSNNEKVHLYCCIDHYYMMNLIVYGM